MDPFRPPSNQGGYEQYGGGQQMGMNNMGGPGGMMHPNQNNMMGSSNSQMPFNGGMMPNNSMPPNTSVMPTSNMMSNSNMPNSQMGMPNSNMPNSMGGNMNMPNSSQSNMMPNRVGMPTSSGDNITVQDPFADNVQMGNNSNQFQRPGMGSQLPPYSASGQPPQQQQNMPNAPGYYQRNSSMAGYNNQPGQQGPQQGPYNSGAGWRGMPGMQPGQQQPPNQMMQQQQGPQPDGFGNQFAGNRNNSMGAGGPNSQFPFGASGDRYIFFLFSTFLLHLYFLRGGGE